MTRFPADGMADDDPRLRDIEDAASVVPGLLKEPSMTCWMCEKREATTGEHKFKAANLTRLMGDGNLLVWGDGDTEREIRGKGAIKRDRYGVVKFPKSLCAPCNNARSKPMDESYDRYSRYIETKLVRIMPGLNLEEIYGNEWSDKSLQLGRYFAKHFGCRMVRDRFPVPSSLRDFLDGATDMPDARLSVVSTDSIHREYGKGESISGSMMWADRDKTRIVQYVAGAYVRSIGIRYEWRSDEFPPQDQRSNFFDIPYPPINFFRTDFDMVMADPRRPHLFARMMRRLISS